MTDDERSSNSKYPRARKDQRNGPTRGMVSHAVSPHPDPLPRGTAVESRCKLLMMRYLYCTNLSFPLLASECETFCMIFLSILSPSSKQSVPSCAIQTSWLVIACGHRTSRASAN